MAESRQSSKLAVILHADIADSTVLVQHDKQLAHDRIQDTFQRFSETIEKYQGHVLEIRGDALLAGFERAADAVSAALSFQVDHAYHLSRLKDIIQPSIRVGIAMGEVVIADTTVTGAGVVQAQRIEQLADSGGVCITAPIHEALSKHMPFNHENLGEKALKGFDYPVRVYRVELKPGASIQPLKEKSARETSPKTPKLIAAIIVIVSAVGGTYWFTTPVSREEPVTEKPVVIEPASMEPALVERMAYPLPDKPSIAVLPFTNMSDDPKQEYFSDGMTEDLITDLSKVSGLFVIARNTVFTYKGSAVKVPQVAEELGVRYVLEGSVRRVGDQVRINAQLIDATTGGHLWAERYDGSLADVFTLQDKVTGQIVSALELNLIHDDKSTKSKTTSVQAYDAFQKGWSRYQRHTAKDLSQAIPLFKEAIELDPGYTQAHAALAAVYWEVWDNRWEETLDITRTDAINQAKSHLQEAMKEPGSLAHWVASNMLIAEGNYATAVTEAEKIVSLDANNADGYAVLANALSLAGKSAQSAKQIEKAARLDPLSSPLHAAAKRGDVDTMKRLIAEGAQIESRDRYGRTPLHISAKSDQAEVAKFLIEAGAALEARTSLMVPILGGINSGTPLIIAAYNGSKSVVELLIAAGADVNARDRRPASPGSVLHYAASSGNVDSAELLIANGAEVNAALGRNLYTPLSMAARNGHLAMAELLISKGADVNAVDGVGATSLHEAAYTGDTEMVKLLIANGANINASIERGAYPGQKALHAAAFGGQTQVAELLLEKGADLEATDQYGYTPLRRAVDQSQLAMVQLLINRGADINTRASGMNLLHVVASTNRVAIADLLIARGTDINTEDNSGFTPLDRAGGGDTMMIELLERHGAKCGSC
jgi:TolB-like protein/ankyrin repeat protein/class 3 adenylate cyclase